MLEQFVYVFVASFLITSSKSRPIPDFDDRRTLADEVSLKEPKVIPGWMDEKGDEKVPDNDKPDTPSGATSLHQIYQHGMTLMLFILLEFLFTIAG